MKNAFALAILACGLIGCQNNASPIVGSWEMSGEGGSTAMTTTFGGDGKVSMNIPGPAGPDGSPSAMTASGTYTLQGENLTSKFTNVTFTNMPVALKSQEKTIREAFLKGQSETETSKVKWNGNDSFTMTTPGGTATFTRKK